ncbi:hypothetical protein P3X46_017479 [Hevea brasiliensis]|uniref:WRKY domain-containing protein n=1 Tax=Hevea brasiliensis TaxID=3981 RepID=A0ABQ9LPR8_HEVBR|nr:hypothetical protein P3X46_017479 [Hevea brasiliensis]
MLPNSQIKFSFFFLADHFDLQFFLPSPTTGTFLLLHLNYESSILNTVIPADVDKGSSASSFRFKPHKGPGPVPDFTILENQENNIDCQAVVAVESSMAFEFPFEFLKDTTTKICAGDSATDMKVDVQMDHADVASNQTSLQMELVPRENVGTHDPQEEEKGTFPARGIGRNLEDGYNWRKYGQKQAKCSENPRSYSKCTHPYCQVRKKIERSPDDQIMEVIYKGAHNHPKPQPNHHEGSETCIKVEVGSVLKNSSPGPKDVKVGSDRRADGMERTSSTSVAETSELSSTLVSNDDDDDRATQGSISIGVDADIEESEKIESCLVETSFASRTVHEPRVVVQIESEVDMLHDGHRQSKYVWSYYKCTSAGCSVRKHVERASHNLKYVITTYEGKHDHKVPAARNNSPALALTRNTKPETQIKDFAPGFDRKTAFNNDYLRPSFPGNFSNETKLGAASIYPLKFPTFKHTIPYSSFEFNRSTTHHSGSIASLSQPFRSRQPLVKPKIEQREDDVYDTGQSRTDHVNASQSSSSLYQHITDNFPS